MGGATPASTPARTRRDGAGRNCGVESSARSRWPNRASGKELLRRPEWANELQRDRRSRLAHWEWGRRVGLSAKSVSIQMCGSILDATWVSSSERAGRSASQPPLGRALAGGLMVVVSRCALVGLQPDLVLSDLVRNIKAGSSSFIKRQRWAAGRFSWQEGFGAFSYSRSQLDAVIRYIQNQQKHHARKTFHQEYVELLERFEIK